MELRILMVTAMVIPVWMIAAVVNLNSRGSELQQHQSDLARQLLPYDSSKGSEMAPPVAAAPRPQASPQAPSPGASPVACAADSRTVVAAGSLIPQPPERLALADPTNYGERFRQDVFRRPVSNPWLIVLHETVNSLASAVRFFQTPHPKDEDQASYHTLIARDGTIVYAVPPEKRAYGAGNSVFVGPQGPEAVKTDPKLPPSVNNFAYHISLESPPDGNNNRSGHSGYTDAQYRSLAWLVAKTQIPESRIATHAQVDRSGERSDPRSFDQGKFLGLLRSLRASSDRCSQSADS